MRIAFFVDAFPVLSETFILNQITGLIDAGHDICIFAGQHYEPDVIHPDVIKYNLLSKIFFYNDKPKNHFFRVLKAVVLLLFYFFRQPKIFLNSINFLKYKKDALSLDLFYKAVCFIRQGKFAIFQCHYGHNGILAARLKELGFEGHIVTMFHRYDIRKASQQLVRYQKLFEMGDLFLSISSDNTQALLQLGCLQEKIIYHPVGINVNAYYRHSHLSQAHKCVIISVGSLSERKNHMWSIEIIQKLLNQGIKNIEYIIIGHGPMRPFLEEKIRNQNLTEIITLVGAKNTQEIIQYLHQADIFFLPSLDEVLPVCLMEAAAASLPIVTNEIGSVHEIVRDGISGFIIPRNSTSKAVEKLKELILDGHKRLLMGKKGRDIVSEKYDIIQLNQKLVGHYQQLINNS